MVLGTDVARVVGEFEQSMKVIKEGRTSKGKHQEIQSTQLTFANNVSMLVKVIESMEKPLKEESQELEVLDSKVAADPSVLTLIKQVEVPRNEQFQNFASECLVRRTKPLSGPIKRNKLALFSPPPPAKRCF